MHCKPCDKDYVPNIGDVVALNMVGQAKALQGKELKFGIVRRIYKGKDDDKFYVDIETKNSGLGIRPNYEIEFMENNKLIEIM